MSLIGLKCNESSLSLFCTVLSITSIELQKCKIANILNYQFWEHYFAMLHFYNFTLVIDTTLQNNDNEISLHFKPMRLIFMNYSV